MQCTVTRHRLTGESAHSLSVIAKGGKQAQWGGWGDPRVNELSWHFDRSLQSAMLICTSCTPSIEITVLLNQNEGERKVPKRRWVQIMNVWSVMLSCPYCIQEPWWKCLPVWKWTTIGRVPMCIFDILTIVNAGPFIFPLQPFSTVHNKIRFFHSRGNKMAFALRLQIERIVMGNNPSQQDGQSG